MAEEPCFDTLAFSLKEYRSNRPQMTFDARTARETEIWQRKLRGKLVELLGESPIRKCSLRPQSLGIEDFGGYTRERVVSRSRNNLSVFGYYLLPKPVPEAPLPAVLCLHGHGRGVDSIVGIAEDGTQRSEYGEYQRDFALQCVDRGFATLAIEQLGFGRRRDERARKGGPGNSSCQPASGAALLLGQTMIGWRVYDAVRALDYMQTRKEVDPARMAAMGISGGGTTTFHLAALDERVKVAVVSGYFNTFKASIFSLSHCMDNYVPGILRYAEMYDIAGLIAPRALFAESGTKDGIFPYKATRTAIRKARAVYKALGCPEKLGLEIFEGEHQFYGKGAFKFLEQML